MMRTRLALLVLFSAMLTIVWVQHSRISTLKNERDQYKANTHALLDDVNTYKTSDSLNAAKVTALEFSLGEYKEFRAHDLALISTLKVQKNDVKSVSSIVQETSAIIKTDVRDSIIYIDKYTTDTLRCIDAEDEWVSVHGCADSRGKFSGELSVRDSLIVVESIKYKRFLGFLWKTKKIKGRTLDVVNRNPHARIVDIEHIYIK